MYYSLRGVTYTTHTKGICAAVTVITVNKWKEFIVAEAQGFNSMADAIKWIEDVKRNFKWEYIEE